MAQLREQLANAPVEGIIAQIAYQLFEVAALHLSLLPPQLDQARLAIEAKSAHIDGVGALLGEHSDPLREGLSQIRMAFVQIQKQPPSDQAVPAPPQT
jgi:hypothetical protein